MMHTLFRTDALKAGLKQLSARHPVFTVLLVLFGFPLSMLFLIGLTTTVAIFPFALAFGWL